MTKTTPITVAYGDGIGPEIMHAVLEILRDSGAKITIDTVEVGKEAYLHGFTSGIPDSGWNIIKKNNVFLKAPITTPQGGGYKSLNVTLRKALGLYANIRPCYSYYPFLKTSHPELDIVIVRENAEDLYTGIEHRLSESTFQSLKLISKQGCFNINKFAFDYAIQNGRKKVSCLSKDNIMKMTDGVFHKTFDEIAANYPEIKNEHYIVDIGMARVASRPQDFDVIVTSNLYGDIVSDIVAEVSGSVGMSGSANIGDEYAMFEAVHGSAPDIAGKGIANPSGLLNAAIMMLNHINQNETASLISNAWLKTIEDGMHTGDIYNESVSKKKLSTDEFAKEVIKRLGDKPSTLKERKFIDSGKVEKRNIKQEKKNIEKKLIGVDIFFDWNKGDSDKLAEILYNLTTKTALKLQMIDVMGLAVWPKSRTSKAVKSDFWRARFVPAGDVKDADHKDVVELLSALGENKFDFVQTENLYMYGEQLGFSLAQGE